MQSPVRVGVDVGGTFTDLIAQGVDGAVEVVKVPSTPANPADGVMAAVETLVAETGIDEGAIQSIAHGSTVSTNAVIERNGARTGVLLSAGFDAIPVVGTMSRPQAHALDPFYTEADDAFLIPSRDIEGVPERIDSHGRERKPLDEDALRERIRSLRESGVESIAVCYLFSFMNAAHEQRTREIIDEEYPECFVSLSSSVIPKIREYPRLSTTAIDAYVGPILATYLQELRGRFREAGITTEQVYLMLSHGGVVPFETAARSTCRTLLSGPAAGVRGAQFFGTALGDPHVITMDMGGTSCDIAIVRDGTVAETKSGSLDEYPLAFPMLEISTIGAGGGTQARVERGRLRVGPTSSGAEPGPICYGRGGVVPTITDANVLLGRLNPSSLLGGEIEVAYDRTATELEQRIADPLDMTILEAAAAVVELVDDKMRKEINVQLSRYGYDAREFVLFPFGGAGPTHAARIARKLDIDRVTVPPWPGINSAAGLLTTNISQEYVRSELDRLDTLSVATIDDRFTALETTAIDERVGEGFDRDEVDTIRQLDLRYAGQGYELTVEVETIDATIIREDFDTLHEARFGHQSDESVEIVSYRVASVVEVGSLELVGETQSAQTTEPMTHRDVYDLDAHVYIETPIYDRATLPTGATIEGPAVIEQLDTTIIVEPGGAATVDPTGNLLVEVPDG